MPSLFTETLTDSVLANSTHINVPLRRQIRVLIVSPLIEVRRPLLRALEKLSTDVVVCSTRAQAEEVLSRRAVEVAFCDEHLADGAYQDLIHAEHFDHRIPRVVVTTRTGDWELYFAALAKGAFDVIRSPWHATDVEMVVIRALREEQQALSSQVAA
jgi:DNA-binding NtrC family response regulator